MKVGRKGYIISEPASCAKLTAPSTLTVRGSGAAPSALASDDTSGSACIAFISLPLRPAR